MSKKLQDEELRKVASSWLQASERAMGNLDNNIHAVFLGSVLFIHDRAMSYRELSRLPFVGSRRSATRWAKKLEEMGVAQKTEDGVIITERGLETARYYFGKMSKLGIPTEE